MRKFLWLDLETTGSEEDEGDEILEFGWALSEGVHPYDVIETGEFLVEPAGRDGDEGWWWIDRVRSQPKVREMHERSGLIEDVLRHGLPVSYAEQALVAFLRRHGCKDRRDPDFVLAGSGVSHFDRRFLRKYTPKLERMLYYGAVDVGSIRRGFQSVSTSVGALWREPLAAEKAHRALADALDARAQLQDMGSALLAFVEKGPITYEPAEAP